MHAKVGGGERPKLTKPAPLRASHVVTTFDCGEEMLNIWLVRRALAAVAERTANTFVVCRGRGVVGYYSLATASVAHEHCTSSLRRNAPNPVPAMLLARLAVDNAEKGKQIGRHLLQDAMKRSLIAARYVAARTLLVHALTEEVAGYYRQLGFLDLPRSGEQITLYLPLEKIVAALKEASRASD
jgi:predicted N-acetyltransferase YhbS